ncbi:MAG: PilZ domain-containing protein, partial [Pseudomonadota bacterium]
LDLMTEDISSGGAFFHTSDPLLEGTEVRIDLILPLDKLKKLKGKRACIKVNGKVLRKGSEGMAIVFNRRYKIIPMEDT